MPLYNRKDMPQVNTQNLGKAISMAKSDVKVTKGVSRAFNLKPSQKELIPAKVRGVATKYKKPMDMKPLIISKDGYIVDGHHRWAAAIQKFGKDVKIPTFTLHLKKDGAIDLYKIIANSINENITVPIKVGDTVLGGKFKNKRIVVKSIGKNDKGDITINGRPLLKFRIVKEGVEVEFPKDMPQDENVNTFFYDDMKKYIYKNRGKINKVMKSLPDNKKYDFLEKLYVRLFKGPTYRMAEKDIKGKGKELHQMLVKDKYIQEIYYDNLGNKCPGPVTLDGRCLGGRNTYQKEGVGMNRSLHKGKGKDGGDNLTEPVNEVGIFKISQFTKGIIPQGRLDTHTPEKKREAIKLIKNFHSMLNAFWRENDIPFRARLK